jgi:glycosyltransferase involved in cell wall biosynthesis
MPLGYSEPISLPSEQQLRVEPRIAIACSGLGRIRRGNEVWAQTVAEGLHASHARVELLGGGPLPDARCPYTRMWNVPRESRMVRGWLSGHHRYLMEQLTATTWLRRYVRTSGCDIIHLADPDMALQIHKRTRGTALKVVFKDGQFQGPHFCSRFQYVQALAPYYVDLARQQGIDTRGWFVIPHLVNVHRFTPLADQAVPKRLGLRDGLPVDTMVVLAVGDFAPASNKRLHWIVQEFARLTQHTNACLFLAGQASKSEFKQLHNDTKRVLGDRARLFCNLQADEMLRLYQAADALVHASLREPFGIVFLEAMACGLPIVAHRFPVTEWVIGDAGKVIDMEAPGELASVLALWSKSPDLRRTIGERARRRAIATFAEEGVIPLYREMYGRIMTEAAIR